MTKVGQTTACEDALGVWTKAKFTAAGLPKLSSHLKHNKADSAFLKLVRDIDDTVSGRKKIYH